MSLDDYSRYNCYRYLYVRNSHRQVLIGIDVVMFLSCCGFAVVIKDEGCRQESPYKAGLHDLMP